MTELGETPQFADVLVRQGNTPPQLENIARFLASQDLKRDSALPAVQYDNLAASIPRYSTELKNKFRNIPEEVLESVVDITFGPARLPEVDMPEDLTEEPTEEMYRFLETSAKMQHAYTHHIISAGRQGADPAYAQALFPRVAIMDYLVRRPAMKERSLGRFWNGVKAEIAVIRALEKAGYDAIELPNYTQSEYDNSGNLVPVERRQVRQWDVKCGIDMVARKDGKVLFVDAKGRLSLPNGKMRTDAQTFVSAQTKFPPDLSRRFMREVRNGDTKHATIVIPTHAHYLSGISSTDFAHPDKVSVMGNFARSSLESDIIEQVKDIQFKK